MSATVQTIELGRGLQPNPVLVKGQGAPVVYLHGLTGQRWDGFLDGLSRKHKVLVPASAGADEPDELKAFDTVHDLVLYYDDVFRALGLGQIDMVGHSFGGMIAAEYAAAYPERVRRLVLIDPLGLWREDAPTTNFTYQTPEAQTQLLLGDPQSEAVKAFMALPEEQPAKNAEIVRRITGMASILHFTWPIPERGLARRLYRIAADTLVVWGEDDAVVSPSYAEHFKAGIAQAQVARIARAGHMPQFSQPADVLDKVLGFLNR
ncbi:MAG: alpha/beta hydrolase [Variovorax sp.]|nr:alpha/beta hydrolase [Variovorax sp.]